MSEIILTITIVIAVAAMIYIACGRPLSHPGAGWRKCPHCLRWHRGQRIQYLNAFTSNPDWEPCHECAAKQKEYTL